MTALSIHLPAVIYTKVQVHMHVAVPLSKVPKYLGTSDQPQLHHPLATRKYPGMSKYLTGLSVRQKDTRSNPSHWYKSK